MSVIEDDACLVYYKEEKHNILKWFTLAFVLHIKTSLDETVALG